MTAINEVTDLAMEDGVAVVTLDSPPVNALSAKVRAGLKAAFEAVEADASARAAVLICAGRTFIAGADISEFGKPSQEPSLVAVQDAIEGCSKPVVAAIHGTALGGGLEVALVCHYRVAVPSAKLGLPEVKLGLLPGAGGTQRLPRIVGPAKALEMVTSGAPVLAKEALVAGLVDELAPEDGLRDAAVAFARKAADQGRPLRRVRDQDEKLQSAKGQPELFSDFRKANARKFRGFEAPEANIACIQAAVDMPFDEGLAFERERFLMLMAGSQSAAQRYYFFAERQVAKIPDVADDTATIPLKKVGVIGAGTMGGGIAMNFASAGIPVTIVEMKQDALDRGLGVIRKNYEQTASRGRMTPEQAQDRIGRIAGSLDFADFADCDLVIEAVYENMDVKKQVFGKLDAICKPGAILASNTSYLDVDQIAAATSRPEQVIGLHFFSPANVMKLLEIVRGEKTSKEVVATSMKLAKTIGKIGVLVGVCHGFVGNRMLAQRQKQAQAMLLEGALPWQIDKALYDFGLPMGPFAMSDLAGLDIGWSKETSTGATMRERLCEIDRRGQKTGAGFYDYDENRTAKPSPLVEGMLKDFVAEKGGATKSFTDEEIVFRCLLPMVNEGAKILADGVAIRASDIDVVWVNGYGWPVYRGGPMFWADTVGLKTVVEQLRRLEAEYGADFTPAPLLVETAERGGRLSELKGAVGGAVKG